VDLPATWDLETDVCVLGSGATALTSAILAADGGCDVAILEKADFVGGTSAISGGVLWIPNHHHMAELGIPDSREDAIDYLESLALGVMDMELVETFVDEAPQMVRYLEEHTPAKWHIFDDYPDYHPEHIGGKPGGGRSLDNDLFPFAELGAWRNAVNTVNPPFPATLTEAYVDGGASLADALLAERRKTDMRGSGQALVGALLKGCLDREIPIRTAMRARDLLVVDDAIVGVRAEHNGTDFYVKARKAVVLGTGGFEWNGDLVKAFLRGPMNGPCSPPENEGDGLLMAMSVGAALGNMSEAWWIPSFRIPGQTVRGKPYHQICLMERTWPGSIIVNSSGRRFTNEAANYNAIGRAFHTFDASSFGFPNLPAWIVFDNVYKEKYRIIDRIVRRANSLRELAKLIQVDADGLEATVARFNTYAVKGEDPDFHRGESVYDSFNGDRSFPAPFTTLGTLDAPPFYAVEVLSGVLGTKGGPKTNTRSQALDTKGRVIRGLYAVGNAMAGTTGMVYGGAGGTLGPGMTYGYIAGINAAKEPNHIK
jgi:succinate dehydrogenase/fumarate reductase flavoprotein subunit